ncbi:hypothetical protein RJT34_08039 [Clitoria ternatea]|uniref:Uncharacterized protein n=1 Tax=Clitoria ternatea TaxID=43366 RepID=A0AAN9K5Q0_CLITE
MEVVVQSPSSPTMDSFDFMSGTMSSPYLSAPSSPKRFGEYYLSAPSSPTRLSQLYNDFDYFSSSSPPVPSSVEDAPTKDDDDEENSFAFFVNDESHKSSRSAEELFDGGKIKPLNLNESEQRRGRERNRASTTTTTSSTSNSTGRRVTRSHSPYRKPSHYNLELEQQPRSHKEDPNSTTLSSNNSNALFSTLSSSKGSKRWRLRDFLLFRSASEGRGSSKDPLRKYSVGYKKNNEEVVKGSSFRSSDLSSGNGSRKKGHVSAHELHYAMKKAESEDMKKRTFLPYRQGILGRLAGFGL